MRLQKRNGIFSMERTVAGIGNQRLGYQEVKGSALCPTEGNWHMYKPTVGNQAVSFQASNVFQAVCDSGNDICHQPGVLQCFKNSIMILNGKS